LGLHTKRWILEQGVYLNSFAKLAAYVRGLFEQIGLTDADVKAAAARGNCFIGVTQLLPPRHRCEPIPETLNDLIDLWLCSCCVVPFFSTPGRYKGKHFVDGGFSAVWSLPPGQPWSEVIKVTCVPSWLSRCSPAMAAAEIQPMKAMLDSIVVLYPWEHQRRLIEMGYHDAKRQHGVLLQRGLRPLPNAPLTPWVQWKQLFEEINEDRLPELSPHRTTEAAAPMELAHEQVLRTYSHSDLRQLLGGPQLQRLRLKAPALSSATSDVSLVTAARR